MQPSLDQFCEQYLKLRRLRTPMVVVTLVGARGSVPQMVGARMIVGQDQLLFGTVGGGKLEYCCTEFAQRLLREPHSDRTHWVTWNLQTELGMSCGGEVSLLFERYDPRETWQVAVFGAGHVAQELVPILLKLDCELTVVDPRMDWLSRLPEEHGRYRKVCAAEMAGELAHLPETCFVLLMTMGHRFDFPILQRALMEHRFPYLGVIGSKAKRARLERELRDAGYVGEMNFFCPVGEDFGSNATVEIALSIVAQLLRLRESVSPTV